MPSLVPPVANEREATLGYLNHQRHLVICAAYGLTDDQARLKPTASALSVGGIIKHLAQTETFWITMVAGHYQAMGQQEGIAAYVNGMTMQPDETLAGLIDAYEAAGRSTELTVSSIQDLGQEFPVPDAPWFPKDVNAWSVRWVLLHLIEETARHAGHADIIRESIDGAQAVSLMAAAERWPESDWVKPWKPSS